MKKLNIFTKSKPRRSESKSQLMEKNNNEIRDGHDHAHHGYATQNTFSVEEDQCPERGENLIPKELVNLLSVCSDSDSEDGCGRPVQPELTPEEEQQKTQRVVQLVQKVVSGNFPNIPVDLNKGLQQHLVNVQEAVKNELKRLGPLMEARKLTGCLVEGCHRQTFAHLHGLLQNVSSVRDSFMLMNWVRHTYLSQVELGRPNHQLFTEWEAKAKDNLLENVQKEIKKTLTTILENERNQKRCDSDEAYVGLYVDIIQSITAMTREAQKISLGFRDRVREVCLKELLSFVRRYATEQKEILGKKVASEKPETIYFLKTLKTCKELKHHIETEGLTVNISTNTSLVAVLVEIESFTLKFLMAIVSNIAERHLQTYFRSTACCFYLPYDLEKHFPKLPYITDEQKVVMAEAYKIISHTYLKRLIQSSLRKLRNCWSANVGQRVSEDEGRLYCTISSLAPGVHCDRMLLKIEDVLECDSMDLLKLIVARMQQDFGKQGEDLELLSALLRWKGLSKSKVREVMDALPDGPQRPSSASCFCCLT